MPEKVLVAMSGGVDSSVAAVLLKDSGFDVSGVYMRTWKGLRKDEVFGECSWKEDIQDAKSVSDNLGINFEIVNFIENYREHVVNYMISEYQSGRTPNPDIRCNRDIKFGLLRMFAKENGFDYIATGHYARKIDNFDGTFDIFQGLDENKDQSYFLSFLSQEQLKDSLFPIGSMKKSEVRFLAEKYNLKNAKKKDSQGICFLGKMPIREFLKDVIPDFPGNIVDKSGKILGRHDGLHFFTIGQRKGIGIPSNCDFKNYVVIEKNYDKNELIIAFDEPETVSLFTKSVMIDNISFTNRPIEKRCKILGKTRYRDESVELEFIPISENEARIEFKEPERAIALGQVLAFYDGKRLLGGGIYKKII